MSLGGGYVPQVHANVISAWSWDAVGMEFLTMDTGWGETAYTQNLACYFPLALSEPFTVAQVWWYNGATVAGNADAAVYTSDGVTKLVSAGSTAMSGASVLQVVNVSDYVLLPGRYWVGFSSDSATAAFQRANLSVQGLDAIGVKQQTSAWSSGLPSSATFAAPSVALFPVFGLAGAVV